MTSDAKIGLLLGLVFIFIIAFIINGLPSFRHNDSDNSDLTSHMVNQGGSTGIGEREREARNEIIDPAEGNARDRVMDMTNGGGMDIALEVAGEAESYQLASPLVKPGGTVVIVGIPSAQEHIPIQAITARRSGLTLKFVRRFNPKDFPRALDMIASGQVQVASLIRHRSPLEEMTPAYKMLHEYADGSFKTIIHPHA